MDARKGTIVLDADHLASGPVGGRRVSGTPGSDLVLTDVEK